MQLLPGNIVFISQSGARGTAILDWAVHENVGFSHFVSVGLKQVKLQGYKLNKKIALK
jgi:acyl-CoA synthetase (NDP forming)